MPDDITNAILRQMSEKLRVLEDIKLELKQFKEETGSNIAELRADVADLHAEAIVTNQRLANVEQHLIDFNAQLLLTGRFLKNSHGKAILDLRKRVGRLERKVGAR